ncbi:DUF2938 domain-containing protein [Simiduia curdlanivorans]|uniref:DUF2938 domain-containing protein n=1 Tax=Simiduia curdlanivorans TaxID=1492769 RepID=A0ABV8V785_9GAMM|nr:DUF2938 domain-containing protein [Simiduia curdlanivorans]MDN3639106.1 DUF2938 domain-containing protein [Simiduia curdlanivorans]
MNNLATIVVMGIGATATMDLWGIARKPLLGVPVPDYGLVGRWLGHMARGRFRHDAIVTTSPIRAEGIIGWTAHYVIGIGFAALLIALYGRAWLQNPSIGPALMVGIGTVAAPFLLMQPGMGAGIAAARTKNPASARVQSLLTHSVFGVGLYLTGLAIQATGSL